MKNNLVRAVILFIAIVSLSHEKVNAEPHSHEDKKHSSVQTPISAKDGLDRLELNNGHKWNMDVHTRTIFAKMSKSFLAAKPALMKKEDLKEAASSLRKDIDELIKGCTMTGDAHDKLHIYLERYIFAVEELSKSGQPEDAKKVRYYLENYGKYFK
jgi:hypothetical protein